MVPMSPAMAVEAGHIAYEDFGYGPIKRDWECCPRWYWQFSEATIDGVRTYDALSEAYAYREKGELSGLVRPPWTKALTDGIRWIEALNAERLQQMREAAKEK